MPFVLCCNISFIRFKLESISICSKQLLGIGMFIVKIDSHCVEYKKCVFKVTAINVVGPRGKWFWPKGLPNDLLFEEIGLQLKE